MSSPLLPTYARADLAFERGFGVWLETKEGARYLDFAGGIAVTSCGHSHPHLLQALTTQAQKLWHVSNLFRIPEAEHLAQRLCEITFADRVFFTNSGTEAIECAIKMARHYHATKGQPEKYRILTFEGAFHGRTLGALAATGNQKYLEGFGPPLEGFDQVRLDDWDALQQALTPQTGALLIEPILGEGGIRVVPPERLRALRHLCDERGLLLILDEVQTGYGRTGFFLAHQRTGITPDLVTLAKGIGGGFPLGACLATEAVSEGMGVGTHGSTYGGNPLAMACGHAVLDILLAPDFLSKVARQGLLLKQQLARLHDLYPDILQEIRGEGLMLGLRVSPPNSEVVTAFRQEGLLTAAAGDNVVRLLPPLIIEEEEILQAVQKMEQAFQKL